MFSKAIQLLTADDISKIVTDGIRESDTVEFKEALSGRDGPDGWHTGAERVGDRARNEILREIIAFANAHGGHLVLGIEESDDHPRRAIGIKPIPRCADLASRIAMYCRDVIEPPLAPHPAIVPINLAGDAGVIVIAISRSRNAPHRDLALFECHARKGDRSERMTMREIQDLTLQVDRGLAQLERRFVERQSKYSNHPASTGLALRATAIAMSPVSIPVPGTMSISPQRRQFDASWQGRQAPVTFPHDFGSFRPILRGVRSINTDQRATTIVELLEDGVVEVAFSRRFDDELILYAGWFIGLVCNALDIVDQTRSAAGASGVEYGLELEVRTFGGIRVATYGGREHGTCGPMASTVFPRYSIGARDTFQALVRLIERDFWHAAGHDPKDATITVNFDN